MELKEYLKEKKLTQTSFIKEVEAKTKVKIPQGTLAKWVLGVRIPRKKEMLILRDITNGEVQPNDFYK